MSEQPRLEPGRASIDGIEEFVYTSEHGRTRTVRRVAIAEPTVWRECTGLTGFVGITVVFVDSPARDAAHYERLRAALEAVAPC